MSELSPRVFYISYFLNVTSYRVTQIIIKKLIEHEIRTKEVHYLIQTFNDAIDPAIQQRFTNYLAWMDKFPMPGYSLWEFLEAY